MCRFCEILRGEQPCHKIYEDEKTFAFLNIKQTFYGLTLVIPKAHYNNMFDCPPEIYNAVVETTKKISRHYRSLGYDGITIFSNNGIPETGQTQPHLHFQILPRSSKNPFPVFNDSRNLDRDFDAEQKKFGMNS